MSNRKSQQQSVYKFNIRNYQGFMDPAKACDFLPYTDYVTLYLDYIILM